MSDRYVDFARRLAMLAPLVGGVACAGPTTPPATTPAASPSAATTTAAPAPTAMKSDPHAPCRCAWHTDATSAPRVCGDHEIDHTGEACVRGADHGPSTNEGKKIHLPPVVGPLAPPDLAV